MNLPKQIATHFKTFYTGGNWTDVNLKNVLEGVTWQQATTSIFKCNTIAVLIYHMNYYVRLVTRVLEGQPLDGSDKFAFDAPPVQSAEDWEQLKNTVFTDAEKFARLIELFPEEKLGDIFHDEKYGSYYRNFQGIVEHNHYHLGQIVLLKKIMSQL
ncbi:MULTISPECIES: DinB family protein [Niastella]|uniref:DinB-like domain-containing protein n=1 Tax=Niastella soli TaxID=2821487 RepID=A0ABS3YVT3_9BACT|nr:DinB family protein [Niastella soli]MBO9201853.1 hypothetical protein [Niastella soli]